MRIDRIELRHIKMVLVKPGIGVEVNMNMLEKVTVRSEEFKGKNNVSEM